MSLLLASGELPARRAVATGPLAPLVASLRADLQPLIEAPVSVPLEKARLTRFGGRCTSHGVLLEFDPWEPRRHRCPTCGTIHTEEVHYRWWIMNYQLWLAERAVHGAVLAALTGDEPCAMLAVRVLGACADRYLAWPNSDNVLGPTRPFFSTYLESIWTLQLAVALDLLEESGAAPRGLGGRVRDQVLAPSAELIGSYDEGMSNRQVWHNAALLACSRLLGSTAMGTRAVHGRAGVLAHLQDGLLADGSWYEGENYHQFAHRGLWYAVTMMAASGEALPPALAARFDEAFAIPFLTALPDFTFPARRDSQYGVSLRQWRYAESCELGLARHEDPRLRTALDALYDPQVPPGSTGRRVSTAEAERNGPPARLDRSSLGWKSLLHARPVLPDVTGTRPVTVHLPHQGFAAFRRAAGRVYVALDYGAPGGGHGHPDRLNLWLVDGTTRWLEDVGTGSYTDPTLFWYRSTWAHNAPLVNGGSQPYGAGVLRAFDEREGQGWIEAAFDLVPGRTHAVRRVVVLEDCLIDDFSWASADRVDLVLPWHAPFALAADRPVRPDETLRPAGSGADLMRDAVVCDVQPTERFSAQREDRRLDGWVSADAPYAWGQAMAPGAPGHPPAPFTYWRATGTAGRWRTVLAWAPGVDAGFDGDEVVLRHADGSQTRHRPGAEGWVIVRRAPDGATTETCLGGHATATARRPTPTEEVGGSPAHVLTAGRTFTRELGERHYRRSELPWAAAGAPEAVLRVAAGREVVTVDVEVRKEDPVFAPARVENPLDNEDPDINSDGVQVHLELPGANAHATWILVPEAEPRVRITRRDAGGEVPPLDATWRLTPTGYAVRWWWPRGPQGLGIDRHFRLNVVINEISRDRERRRGQLVATGARDEWVYLRGDREDRRHMLAFDIRDD